MSNSVNTRLVERAAEIYKVGSPELKAMIRRCIEIKDLEGLQWTLDHATLEDVPLPAKTSQRDATGLRKLTSDEMEEMSAEELESYADGRAQAEEDNYRDE